MLSTLFVVAATLAGAPASTAPVPLDPTAVRAPAQTSAPAQSLDDLAHTLGGELEAEDYEAALATLTAIHAHPDFAAWPQQRRRGAILLLGLLNADFQHNETALPLLVQSTSWNETPAEVWLTRIQVEARLHDTTAAARSLTTVIQRFPAKLPDLSKDFLIQMARAPDVAPDAAFDLGLALYEAGWRNEEASFVWVQLIDDLMKHDRTAEAVPVVALVTSPAARLQLHALKRYDALMAQAGATDFDVAEVYAQDLEKDRTAAEAATGDKALEKRHTYMWALLGRGRDAEVLAMADEALARPDNKSDQTIADARTWIMDTRGRALMTLGRYDEALAQQQSAAARSEHGDDNVSQQINLGWLYLRLGRDADALAAVKTIGRDQASPYGVMQAVQVRGCAAHALGNRSVEATAYGYMAEHWKDAPGAWRDALACKGDIDAIAALLLEQLADPEQADEAVADMHTWRRPAGMTDFDRRIDAAVTEAMARPEVIAARDAVGRAYTLPVLGDSF